MSRFFIRRPIFATVISIVITLAGLVASQVLPVAQYPEIAPPTVSITATYPGASAETVSRTVAAPIEEQLSGVEGLLYFSSTASSTGTLSISATFDVGTNVDLAIVTLTNRVRIAEPRLPDEVRRSGVLVQKRSFDILLVVSLRSDDPRYDTLYLSNFALVNVLDALKRVPGVADASIFGPRDYSMRIWLQPDRMASLGITTTDVANALRSQNAQFAAGKIGAEPAPADQALVYTVTARGRMLEPEEFGEIILRSSGTGGVLRLRDVARVELGALSYDQYSTVNGRPNIGIGVYMQSGANALEVAERVKRTMAEISGGFPAGVNYLIPFDTTRFVEASIDEVLKTLLEAALLVLAVVFVFLQSWRATIIPFVAVPVALIGAFAGLYAFGFSINTLTLFAIVLATGIVVDDAIVVLENVERLMAEQRLSPREAAIASMTEVSGAIVAIVLVLSSVFIPVAFLGGIAGQLYKQFAVTIATSVTLSGVVALTLTPAMCALVLKARHEPSVLFKPFNRAFAALTAFYTGGVRLGIRFAWASVLAFVAIVALCAWLIQRTPTAFVPAEDQGYIFGRIGLPEGATLARTNRLGSEVQKIVSAHPAVQNVLLINGFDLLGGGTRTNAATLFITLKPWKERKETSNQVVGFFFASTARLRDGVAISFAPSPIRGLGTSGGFEAYVQSRGDSDAVRLAAVTQQFADALRKRSELTGINTFFRPTTPQLHVEVDRERAIALGVPVSDVFDALQATMGALYVNDFNKLGRSYRVLLQADAPHRARPEDLGAIYVRAQQSGEMVPLRSLIQVRPTVGPDSLERFNGLLSARVLGSAAAGVSSGDAIGVAEQVAEAVLPAGYALAWTGAAFQQKRATAASTLAFALGIVMVFLILAAQYERWTLPIAVLLAVPFALLGALLAVLLRGFANDIYFQIGLVTLIGLAAKNAILIVEFASQNMEKGMPAAEAAIEAARQRFRPIIMTSLAFMFGVLPLAIATGAGAGARQSMGTGVFGGMLIATFVAPLFIPVFFVLLSRWRKPGPRTLETGPVQAEERA